MFRSFLWSLFFISFTCTSATLEISSYRRHLSSETSHYIIECNKQCGLKIQSSKSGSATSSSEYYSKFISDFIKAKENGAFPQSKKTILRPLYDVTLKQGSEEIKLSLDRPQNYEGKEFEKYLQVIKKIESLKLAMEKDLFWGKK